MEKAPLPPASESPRLNEFLSWAEGAFAELPACGVHAFRALWKERLFKFDKSRSACDIIDEFSSRLVWSALMGRKNLLVVLPDFAPHRPSVLLGTGLVYSLLNVQTQIPGGISRKQRITYFGTHVGIREQLSALKVSGWGFRFSDVFPQCDLGRTGSTVKSKMSRRSSDNAAGIHTPEVVTVYAPADPMTLLTSQRPDWIALDLADNSKIQWLPQVLCYARDQQVPVIAWGQNPLSDVVIAFERSGSTFIWPLMRRFAQDSLETSRSNGDAFDKFEVQTSVEPVVMAGTGVSSINEPLQASVSKLAGISTRQDTLASAATLAHWRMIRNAECLCVPVEFYEGEAQRLYGLRPFSYLLQSCKSFQRLCSDRDHNLTRRLEEAESYAAKALEEMRCRYPPIWTALCNLIVDQPSDNSSRMLVFSSRSRKQLFLLALLAHHNITEDDLASVAIFPMTLEELNDYSRHKMPSGGPAAAERLSKGDSRCTLLLPSLPSPVLTGKLLPCFLFSRIELLIYPYQQTACRRVTEWAARCNSGNAYLCRPLSELAGREPHLDAPLPPRVLLQPSGRLEIDSAKKSTLTGNLPPLLKGFDPADELAKLFADDEPEQETVLLPGEDGAVSQDPVTDVWCDRAVHLRFEQGWSATYAPEDKLNVVVQLPEGPSTEERHVQAVRVGDRVLLISGERRQSLYDLLISRVHNHPGFALHVALVRRWQTDVAQAYHKYSKAQSNPLNRLLQELQSEGSAIQTAQAIRNWLTGDVLCPDDPEDLRRLGRILRIGFVTQQYRRVHEAKKRLWTCHRVLSRRLNCWLVAQLGHTEYADLHKVIDEELGITFDDFRNSLLLLRVVEKREMSSPTLRSELGRLNRSST